MSDEQEPTATETAPAAAEEVAQPSTAAAAEKDAAPATAVDSDSAGAEDEAAQPKAPAGKKSPVESAPPSLVGMLTRIPGGMASGAASILSRTAGATMEFGRAMLRPERLDMMAESGRYLRDMREVAGLTLMELSEALDLEDKTLLEAVERGTATLSFDLILRSAALVARHDPVPYVMRMTRTYNPTIWRILDDWGVGRLSLQIERERQFINIFRRHDAARKLSDEGFAHVLAFTRSAFDMALHFVAEQEGVEDKEVDVDQDQDQPSGRGVDSSKK